MKVKELAVILKNLVAEGKGDVSIYMTVDGKVPFPVKTAVHVNSLGITLLILKGND